MLHPGQHDLAIAGVRPQDLNKVCLEEADHRRLADDPQAGSRLDAAFTAMVAPIRSGSRRQGRQRPGRRQPSSKQNAAVLLIAVTKIRSIGHLPDRVSA